MRVTNIYQAKTHLSRLIESALNGEEVIISKAGKPLVKLVPYHPQSKKRKPGYWRNKVKISDDFDQLPTDIEAAFKGQHE